MVTREPSGARRVGDGVLGVVEWAAVVAMVAMMLHIVANAVLRTVFRAPLPGTLEVTQYWYLPVIALLGLIVAQARNEHIFADLLFDGFPPLAKRFTTILVELITAAVAFAFAWFGFLEGLHSLEIGETLGNTELPRWPGEVLLGVAYTVFGIQLLYAAYAAIRFGITIETHHTAGDVFDEDIEQGLDREISHELEERRA